LILDEIKWDHSFSQSENKLSELANEAKAEYKSGKTRPFNPK